MKYYTLYNLPVDYDFANRFRSGEMPLAIADYTLFNQLTVFAPEIKGLWGMTNIPGTEQPDGTINYAEASVGTAVMMLEGSKKKEAAWKFMEWWTSAEAQSNFGSGMESILGASAKYPTANAEALSMLPWTVSDYKSIQQQWLSVKGVPEVPGGYFSGRCYNFAFNKAIKFAGEDKADATMLSADPGDILQDYVKQINAELSRKRQEFGK